MNESFIIKAYRYISEGQKVNDDTIINAIQIEIARREFNEFPTDEQIKEFKSEYPATWYEIVKCYR